MKLFLCVRPQSEPVTSCLCVCLCSTSSSPSSSVCDLLRSCCSVDFYVEADMQFLFFSCSTSSHGAQGCHPLSLLFVQFTREKTSMPSFPFVGSDFVCVCTVSSTCFLPCYLFDLSLVLSHTVMSSRSRCGKSFQRLDVVSVTHSGFLLLETWRENI